MTCKRVHDGTFKLGIKSPWSSLTFKKAIQTAPAYEVVLLTTAV